MTRDSRIAPDRIRAINQRWLATEGLDDRSIALRNRVDGIRKRYPARPGWWRPRARREWDRLFGELCHWVLDQLCDQCLTEPYR